MYISAQGNEFFIVSFVSRAHTNSAAVETEFDDREISTVKKISFSFFSCCLTPGAGRPVYKKKKGNRLGRDIFKAIQLISPPGPLLGDRRQVVRAYRVRQNVVVVVGEFLRSVSLLYVRRRGACESSGV